MIGLVPESNQWRADRARYMVGFESAGTSLSALPQSAVLVGTWLDREIGIEGFFGFSLAASTAEQTQTQTPNPPLKTLSVVTSNTGTSTPGTFILGGVLKYRLVQTSWFQVYLGALVSLSPSFSSSYTAGSRTEVTPNTDVPGDRTITENGYGPVSVKRSLEIALGPKVGTEFYVKWFPHLALGFSGGILTSFGGDTTTTSSLATRSYSITGGVDNPPASSPPVSTVADTKRGVRGATFGLGGVGFQFTGLFTIRYIW